MDRAIHSDAGAVLARRISAHGPGRDESARRDRRAPGAGGRRSLATLARVRRDAFVAITDEGVNQCTTTITTKVPMDGCCSLQVAKDFPVSTSTARNIFRRSSRGGGA